MALVLLLAVPGPLFAALEMPDWFWLQKVESLNDRLLLDTVEGEGRLAYRVWCFRNHAVPGRYEIVGFALPADLTVADLRLSDFRRIEPEVCLELGG